jgi:hypothetical protein
MRTTPARVALSAAAGALAWLCAMAAPAAAGTYDVVACRAASAPPGQPAPSAAFSPFTQLPPQDRVPTGRMTMVRGCVENGGRVSGLVAENSRAGGRVRRGQQAGFFLDAPPGVTISHLWWSGKLWRRDCRYSVQAYGLDSAGAPARVLENRQAHRDCPRKDPRTKMVALATVKVGSPKVPVSFPMPPGVTRIVQRVVCVGGRNGFCTNRSLNRIVTWYARATINDPHPPTATIAQDNAFTQGAWTSSGSQTVGYTATDPVGGGVRSAVALAGGGQFNDPRPGSCDDTRTVPCPGAYSNPPVTGRIGVETDRMPEGTQPLVVRALDAAGNPGDSAAVTVRVDRTAPAAPAVSVEGGEQWRAENSFAVGWQSPDEGDRAPITAAHWRLCRPDGTSCTTGSQTGTGIARLPVKVPDQGEWDLRVSRQDAAGNHNADYASQPVRLRLDQERPTLSFEPSAPEDPTRVSVAITEKISSIASAQMEISAEGSNTWQALGARLEGNRLVAHIDDAAVAPGRYLVRAQATDLANNVGVAGASQPLTLPLRIESALQAGVVRVKTVREPVKGKKGRRGKRRRTSSRKVIELLPEARVRWGKQATIAGRLTNRDGNPLPGQQVRVLGPAAGGGEQLLAVLTTDAQGAFSYRADGSASRTLRLVHAGTPTVLPAEARVGLVVPAAGSFKASRKRVRNGGRVVFRGRVRSLPVPATGKLVEVQVKQPTGEWTTFRTLRTDAQGRWRLRYRFRRTACHTRYRLRARIPAEAGYPFATGRSRARSVLVRGAEGPCP